ncbi:NYNRIN-like protein [Tanacetum coccineum]
MASPRTLSNVQALNGKLAALGLFLAKSAERSLPFFKTLKGCINKKDFKWNAEAKVAFQELKEHLQSLPALTVPRSGETLTLYLAAANEAISAVLLTERKSVQKPIYFVTRALQGAGINYPNLDKVALALVHAARRLCRYFQAHIICVITDQLIRQVLLKPKYSGCIAKWAIELGEHKILYKPRSVVKGHILADFLAKSPTINNSQVQKVTNTPKKDTFTDGASSVEGSGAGLILTDPRRQVITYALRFNFGTSNNEAEYEALMARLELAVHMEAECLEVYIDSLLIANQVEGLYEVNEELMKRYLAKVKELHDHFNSFTITQITQSKNKRTDTLSKLASSSFAHLTKSVMVEVVPCRSHEQANYVPREAHFGSCRAHAGSRSITQKAARLGYYWPTMHRDVTRVVETCPNCHQHTPIIRQPQCEMTRISSPLPFHQWGIDIVGPFPEAPGRVKFLIVAIDYFIRWVEAKPVATISGVIISDNGKQFAINPFREWCEELKIKQDYTSVAHPQANGQTEVTNRTILQGLKTRLGKAKGQWVKELPNVIWAYRTRAHAANRCTPFSLVYGSEAVLPSEIANGRLEDRQRVIPNDSRVSNSFWKG